MNLLKLTFILSGLLILQNAAHSYICVNTSANYKMFGSVLRSGALARGHELAFQGNNFSDYKQFSAETDADLAKQIQNMANGSCDIVLGLFTSRDCLIAGPIFKKNKLIGISSSCGHEGITNFQPYLYTIIPPINEFVAKIISYLNNKASSETIFIIHQPTDIYSQTSFNVFKRTYHKTFVEIPVESDGQFDLNQFLKHKNDKHTLVFLTYPLPSAKILMQLADNHIITKNTTLIGASSWTFDISVFRPIRTILEKARDVIAVDVLNWHDVKQTPFTKNFIAQFNREPLNIEILTYDVTQLAMACYKKSFHNHEYHQSQFQDCMTNTPHQGISGNYSFSKSSPFAHRKIYLTHFLNRIPK